MFTTSSLFTRFASSGAARLATAQLASFKVKVDSRSLPHLFNNVSKHCHSFVGSGGATKSCHSSYNSSLRISTIFKALALDLVFSPRPSRRDVWVSFVLGGRPLNNGEKVKPL
ncbi:EEP domain-containing protein [Sesbania bispinosa]|nr:EEP domain-containing protein [Sesbania bispinosa]